MVESYPDVAASTRRDRDTSLRNHAVRALRPLENPKREFVGWFDEGEEEEITETTWREVSAHTRHGHHWFDIIFFLYVMFHVGVYLLI